MVSLSILVAAGRKKEGLAMVTAMEDASPNGVREEEEEVTPQGQPGVEGPPAMRSTQGADTPGGEERRRRRGVTYLNLERYHSPPVSNLRLMKGFYETLLIRKGH